MLSNQTVSQKSKCIRRAFESVIDLDIILPLQVHVIDRCFQQISDRVRLACRKHVVSGLVLLRYQTHRLDIGLGVSSAILQQSVFLAGQRRSET